MFCSQKENFWIEIGYFRNSILRIRGGPVMSPVVDFADDSKAVHPLQVNFDDLFMDNYFQNLGEL